MIGLLPLRDYGSRSCHCFVCAALKKAARITTPVPLGNPIVPKPVCLLVVHILRLSSLVRVFVWNAIMRRCNLPRALLRWYAPRILS